ncbi:hypothetical protein N431DRAFT_212747 [Stipitochalara longipes BDJ]|nr:hypothetical protein N431DRAFT_212747 [Stipitochalara longipes BDJ]
MHMELIPRIVSGTFKNSTTDVLKNWGSLGRYNHIPGLLAIFLLPYFTRVWIIQEVAASPLVRVYYGANASCSWDDLESVSKASSGWGLYSFGTDAFMGGVPEHLDSPHQFSRKSQARSAPALGGPPLRLGNACQGQNLRPSRTATFGRARNVRHCSEL